MVSCLLVTLPVAQRFTYLQRSIAAYCRQTWNDKELVIVLDSGSADARNAVLDHVSALERHDVRIVESRESLRWVRSEI